MQTSQQKHTIKKALLLNLRSRILAAAVLNVVPIHLKCKYDEEDDFKSKVMLIAESQSVQRNGLILISSNIKYYPINGLYMRETDLF